jgi:hypothetical protein
MQALTNSLHIVLYHDDTDIGMAAKQALEKKCGKPKECVDKAGYLYLRFSHAIEGLNLTIETKPHQRYVSSLHPDNGIVPDLIFVFSRCAAINKGYRIGDFVIVDQPDPSSLAKQIVRRSLSRFHEISTTLADIKADSVDPEKARCQILAFLATGKKTSEEINNHLKLTSQEDWNTVLENVLQPGVDKYWQITSDYSWELTTEGIAEKNKGENPYHSDYPRKPTIHIGNSHDSGRMITSTTNDKNADVIDQLSKEVFRSKEVLAGVPTVNVCAVKCLEGADPEEKSPFARSIGDAFVDFMLQVAQEYKRIKAT